MSGAVKSRLRVDAICDNHDEQRREYWQSKGHGPTRRWILVVAKPAATLRSSIPFGTFPRGPA